MAHHHGVACIVEATIQHSLQPSCWTVQVVDGANLRGKGSRMFGHSQ